MYGEMQHTWNICLSEKRALRSSLPLEFNSFSERERGEGDESVMSFTVAFESVPGLGERQAISDLNECVVFLTWVV